LAFIVTEHQMVRYNTGRLMGACPSRLPPGSELVAFYPPDTLSATYPLVRLKWTLSAPPQRVQAERFETWLKDDPGKRFLNDAALRPPGLQMRDPLSKDNGALDAPYLRRELTTSEFDAVRKRRTEAQRPVRLLLALDASGSMLDRAGPDDTRFSLAVKGLERSLGLAGPGDQIGLWVFQGDGRPQPLAPVGPKPGKVWDALADVNPSGGTPLYLSIMEGVASLTAMEAPQYNSAVIVLTDGEDSGTGPSPAQMLSAVHGKEIKVFVAVTGTASCATQAIADVTSSTGGRCFPLGAASLDRDVVALFTVLWGGS
jgi:Ca-activated chloride channel family protein